MEPAGGLLRLFMARTGRLLAALALVMFVATGASHDLLHMDEPASHAVQVLAAASAAPASGPTLVSVAGDLDLHADLPAAGCSAHSASAHAADRPPAPCDVPNPPELRVDWRPSATLVVHDLTPATPHGPPRA